MYERVGARLYSIGYKAADGTWAFKLHCSVGDIEQRAKLRREALRKAADIRDGAPPADGTFAALTKAWLHWQKELPDGTADKRAASTLAENEREIAALNNSFGPMLVGEIEKGDAYKHLDACLIAKDKHGNPRPRPEKGNKEIALARRILEWGVRRRWIDSNPFDGVEKLKTAREARLVSDQEMALAVEVGRAMGGPQHIVALALKTAWLCLRRSVEVRALTRDQITTRGIEWRAAKRQRGQVAITRLIKWSPELRATMKEALAI
ncbi:MAG: hypothetical protein QM750_04440 [Rubrivivax sp.]